MKVRLALHARNLRSVHKFRPSSPYATVSTYTGDVRDAFFLGKTEAIQFTSGPMWVRPIVIDYEYGAPMQVKVSIFDQSPSSSSKSGDKPMGNAVVFDIDAVLKNNVQGKRSVGGLVAKDLSGGDGWIFLQANIIPDGEEMKQLALTIEGRDLLTNHSGRAGTIVKPETFYELCRKNIESNGKSWARPVYRSEVAKGSSKPKWGTARVSLDWLCDGDITADVQISIFEHKRTGKHKQIAMCVLSVDSLVRFNRLGLTWEGKDSGKIKIVEALILKDPRHGDPAYTRSSSCRSTTSAKTTSSSSSPYSRSTYGTIGTAKTMHTKTQSKSVKEKRSSEPSSIPGTFTVVLLKDDEESSSPRKPKKRIEETKRKVRSKSLDVAVPAMLSTTSTSVSSSKSTSSPRQNKTRRKPRSSSFDQAQCLEQSCLHNNNKNQKKTKKRLSFDTAIHYSPHPSQDNEEVDCDWGEEEAILAAVKATSPPKLQATRRRTDSIGASPSSSVQPSETTTVSVEQKPGRRRSLDVASSTMTRVSPKSPRSSINRSSVKGSPMHVELLLHARNLKNLSKLSGVSDPYATVSLIDPLDGGAVRVLGTTEV